ncbi:exocyst complex component 6-like isoform X1 [Tachypleus tridentatus]|uniref:exocyst complex component 6-like isoform X1 n=1 Tax=Tachypleus tridentatus TaxID=6853 RepID=UPI003FD22A2B
MFPCTPPAESSRSNIAYLGMISQCLLIQNLLEGLKKVHSRCALLILGRVREADKKKNIFSALKKNQRDKKKLVETVPKQLRQLTSNSD